MPFFHLFSIIRDPRDESKLVIEFERVITDKEVTRLGKAIDNAVQAGTIFADVKTPKKDDE